MHRDASMPVRSTNRPPSVHDGHVPVPGGQLYLREVGDGPTVVVLHGGPDFNHNYLLPELDRLAGGMRLVYYDQRGRGKSSPGVAADAVTLESEIDDLDKLRQHFGLDAIALLGHSWGAVLAMEYATRHPSRVSHLILLNTAPASHADRDLMRERREATEPATLAKMRALAGTAEYARGDVEVEGEYYRAHFGRTLRGPDRLDALVRRLRSHFGPEDVVKARAIEDRLYAQTWSLPDYDILARLRTANMPTLVVHGDRDLVPVECANHVAAAIAGSRLLVLADCGHFSFLDRPSEVVAAIAGFLGTRR